jgi:hypothetical protein
MNDRSTHGKDGRLQEIPKATQNRMDGLVLKMPNICICNIIDYSDMDAREEFSEDAQV